MFAFVNKFTSHHPRLHAAQWKYMVNRRLEFQRCFQIHFQIEKIQQVHHETVDHIRFIAFTNTVQVERMLRKYHAEPLQNESIQIEMLSYMSDRNEKNKTKQIMCAFRTALIA